jgi:transposase InsO family protein
MITHTQDKIQTTFSEQKISQRRVLRVSKISSSTYRYFSKQAGKDKALTNAIYNKIGEYPRYGYRKVCALLQDDNWDVNPKRVYRIWHKEGLKVRRKSKKHRSKGNIENGCRRFKSQCKNDIWAMDFIHDSTINGSTLKCLTIVDEYTRESLSSEVGNSFSGKQVADILLKLFKERGVPNNIRTDNGKEFTCKILKRIMMLAGCNHLLISPASPWDNSFSESFNSIFRDDFLNMNIFSSLNEAKRSGPQKTDSC